MCKDAAGLDVCTTSGQKIKLEISKREKIVVDPLEEWLPPFIRRLLEKKQVVYYLGDQQWTESE